MNGFSAPIVCYLSQIGWRLHILYLILIQVMWKNRQNKLMHSKLWLDRKSNFLNPLYRPPSLSNELSIGLRQISIWLFRFYCCFGCKNEKKKKDMEKKPSKNVLHSFPAGNKIIVLHSLKCGSGTGAQIFLHLALTVQFQY